MQITKRLIKESAREYAFRILKENIINLELKPGIRVSEYELANEMGLSRTPVREALIELDKSKIVESYPQKGIYISKIDYALVEEAKYFRLVLEKAIIELICNEAEVMGLDKLKENLKLQEFYLQNPTPDKLLELDNEFHRQLFEIANKMQIYSMLDSMTIHFDRVRSLSLKTIKDKDIKIVEDHQQIIKAIEERDAEKGIQIMTNHLSRNKMEVVELQQQYPDIFI